MVKEMPSVRKILQALYYIQSCAPNDNQDRFNKVYLLKMIYLADRYHARHYGCLATDDNYYAMKLGPVAEVTYNTLKKCPYNINSAEVVYFSDVQEISEYEVHIAPQRKDELSVSFIKSLNFALEEFGNYSWSELSEISHYYPEWSNQAAMLPSLGRVPMDTRDFFDDPADETCFRQFNKNRDPFYEADKEFLMLLREGPDADIFSA